MAENTKIEWCHHTFNGWIGCTRVSPGCDNCYAEAWAKRYGRHDWQPGTPRVLTSDQNWKQPLRWDRKAAATGERHRVFCASLADVFDPHAPEDARARLWALIDATPNLDWLLLTKRPNLAAGFLPADFDRRRWPNIWLGFTAEDQEHFDKRWPYISTLDAAVRFVSYEPMLGPLRLNEHDLASAGLSRPDWIIWGGESGAGARPPEPDWARAITYDCQRLGIPVFGKQWGHYRHNPLCREPQARQPVGQQMFVMLGRPCTVAEAKIMDPPEMGKGGALLDRHYWRGIPRPHPRTPAKTLAEKIGQRRVRIPALPE